MMNGWSGCSPARYILNGHGEGLHVLYRVEAAQPDRSLEVLPCAAPARGHAVSFEVHPTELADGPIIILRRGLLDPSQRLRVVHIHTEAVVVHAADHPLAQSVTPLGSDFIRRHRSRVVDRHALAPVVDAASELGRFDVALV